MTSLYAQFVKETVDWETLEDEDSFVTYQFQEVGPISCLKIIEMYVAPQARGKNKWRDLSDKVEEIAKQNKATKQKPPRVDFSSIVLTKCSDFRKIEMSKLLLYLFCNILILSC